jgi:hypothetical protein
MKILRVMFLERQLIDRLTFRSGAAIVLPLPSKSDLSDFDNEMTNSGKPELDGRGEEGA